MSAIKNFLTGQLEFKVQGLPQACLNKLRSFKITNVRVKGDLISFNVALVHAAAIKKLLNNFEYETQENYNLFRGVNFLLNHLVLVASVITALIVFFIADMKIYAIKVQCNNSGLTTAVYKRLDELGIEKFMWKNKLNEFNLATDILQTFQEIAHANVKVSGNTLVVNLVAVTNQEEKNKTNFYAQYDGVIKEIITYSGTAMVTAGDVVKKGDLLVANVYPDSVVVTGEVAFKNGDQISRLVSWLI